LTLPNFGLQNNQSLCLDCAQQDDAGRNQLAKWTVDVPTGQIPEPEEIRPPKAAASDSSIPPALSEYVAAIGRKGGQIGGKRRPETMSGTKRRKIASEAAKARWKKRKNRQK
jgi:hypothetical protein